MKHATALATCCLSIILLTEMLGSQEARLPKRAEAPRFSAEQFEAVFFDDVKSTLFGSLPSGQQQRTAELAAADKSSTEQDDPLSWKKLISSESLEDLIKGSKLRLDSTVTSQPAYMSGGYSAAQTEFSLLALLFAIIESHPDDVRWKSSAAAARELLWRAAKNAKASPESFREAKNRLADLGELVRGAKLSATARTDLDWSELVDRSSIMKLLEWADDQHISDYAANEASFSQNRDALLRYAELVSVLGKAAIAPGMPDADDDDYAALAKDLIDAAQQVRLSVQSDSADSARQAAAALGQACDRCHEDYL